MTLYKSKTDSDTGQWYEWMTHNSCHEVTSVEFCDWMEVNVEVKKTKREEGCASPRWVKARCIRPSSSERVAGWICIHVVGPWENVSLGCIVSHIGSHLENHLPTSPCSSSLSPPLALPVHSAANTHTKTPFHSQNSFILRLSNCPNAQQRYTQTQTCFICKTHARTRTHLPVAIFTQPPAAKVKHSFTVTLMNWKCNEWPLISMDDSRFKFFGVYHF